VHPALGRQGHPIQGSAPLGKGRPEVWTTPQEAEKARQGA
jgi:hypothetical protein